MPSYSHYKTLMQKSGNTIGEALRKQSNEIMEATWWSDTQSVVGYIYDYYHDDFDEKGNTLNQGMTYENTKKTKVYVKHIYDAYGSMAKDSPAMYLQFIPSQKLGNFSADEELYYFQKDYMNKYGNSFGIGMYIDLPNPELDGIYEKYLICKLDTSNAFPKYFILKCDYNFQYIEINKGNRIKRHIWGVVQSQNS